MSDPRGRGTLMDTLGRPLPLAALATLLRLPALFTRYSFSADETIYSALAVRLLHGYDPYAGAVDHKPVGIELFYALVYRLAGQNRLLAVHVALIAIIWMTALVLRRIGRTQNGAGAASLAGLFYVCGSAAALPADGQSANTELLLNLPIALAALWTSRALSRRSDEDRARDDRLGTLLMAGALTGVAALFKYQAALAGAAWAMAVAVDSGATWRTVRRLAALAAGFAIVAAALCAFFFFRGEWDPFVFWGWRYNFLYINTLSAGEELHNFLARTPIMMLFWLPLFVLAVEALRRREAPRWVVAWLAADCLAISIGGRFYLYYFQLVLPPLCVIAACGAPSLLARGRGWRTGIAALGAGSIAVAMVVACGQRYFQPQFVRDRQREMAAGEWVRAHSAPDDRLFVWGSSSQIYYFADRVMGTRFVFCNYQTGKIWGSWAAAVDAGDTSALVVPRSWTELLDDLDRASPAFIVDAAAGGLAMFDRHPLTRYPELARRVADRYQLAATVDRIPIYRRQAR